MPYGDRRGPWGRGPMTGRGAGYCAGYSDPGYANPRIGRGRGYGRGYGRGFGRGRGRGPGFGMGRGFEGRRIIAPLPEDYPYDYPEYYGPGPMPEISKDDEKNYLTKLVESLEKELKEIKTRLKELAKEPEK